MQKTRIKPDGTAPIYIVLRINGKPKLIFTGKYINSDNFDNHSGKVGRGEANAMKLNFCLGAKLALIEKIFLDFQHEGMLMQGRKPFLDKTPLCFKLYQRVPASNFYRRLKDLLDLDFLYELTVPYYGKRGQKSIDPGIKVLLPKYSEKLLRGKHL